METAAHRPQVQELMGASPATAGGKRSSSEGRPPAMERKPRPQREQALNCPRCNSTNTKFCYYNNYSLTQPRYFCKTCRRYWTEGGSLRNVPVGGGSRKNKRSYSTGAGVAGTPLSVSRSVKLPPALPVSPPFPLYGPPPQLDDMGMGRKAAAFSAMDLLRSKISACKGMDPFMPVVQMPVHVPMPEASAVCYPTVFCVQGMKGSSSSGLPLNGGEEEQRNMFSSSCMEGVQEAGSRLLFPFEDLRQVTSTATGLELDDNRIHDGVPPAGFWNGGGSW